MSTYYQRPAVERAMKVQEVILSGNHSIDYDGITIGGMQINYYKNNDLIRIEPFSYVLIKSIRTGKKVQMMKLNSDIIMEMVIDGNMMILYDNVYNGYQYNFIKIENK